MLRFAALLLVAAGIGALFGPRRLRVGFWIVASLAILYTALRLAGVIEGPQPAVLGAARVDGVL